MRKTVMLEGVPRALAMDAWWLDGPTDRGGPQGQARLPGPARLVILVLMADLLFWDHDVGLSLAIFAVAAFLLATLGSQPLRVLAYPLGLLALGAAPVIELVQPLSVVFLVLAFAVALVWARHPDARPGQIAAGGAVFLRGLPLRWVAPLHPVKLRGLTLLLRPTRVLRDWAFPVGGSLILLALLLEANPMLASLLNLKVDLSRLVPRGMFWLGTAMIMAPVFTTHVRLGQLPVLSAPARLPGFGLNARSVLRALILFNLMLGVQMGTDASILIGGADLPSGLTHAAYAHRGAYPLLATAVLAGIFTLAARPFWEEHRLIRPLLLVWLGQNVVLCAAAALRLDLYIVAYGLTYLRLYALIWMALVAVGLALLGCQLIRGRDGGWLILRSGALGLATLYVCCFVNFAQIIAAQQLGSDHPDIEYVCDLGPMAAAAMVEKSGVVQEALSVHDRDTIAPTWFCRAPKAPQINGWQEWGFRAARVAHRVQEVSGWSGGNENLGRR